MPDTLAPYTVIYTIETEGIFWQGFYCMAEDSDHAEEQFENAYPTGRIAWINEGHTDLIPIES